MLIHGNKNSEIMFVGWWNNCFLRRLNCLVFECAGFRYSEMFYAFVKKSTC